MIRKNIETYKEQNDLFPLNSVPLNEEITVFGEYVGCGHKIIKTNKLKRNQYLCIDSSSRLSYGRPTHKILSMFISIPDSEVEHILLTYNIITDSFEFKHLK